MVASTSFGSPGYETNFFGQKTASALARFQQTYLVSIGIVTATGTLDEKTRIYINSLGTAAAPTTATPATQIPPDRATLIAQIKAQILILQQQIITLLLGCVTNKTAQCN
jgi:peptidoglycan hydrolase-like protein with peptidoglycan-binding domain